MKICKIVAKILLIITLVTAGIMIFASVISSINALVLSGNPSGQLQKIVDDINANRKPGESLVTLEEAAQVCALFAMMFFSAALACVGTVIVSALALAKLGKAKKKGDTLVLGILSIIFASVPAGVLLIVISELLPEDPEVIAAEKTVDGE